MKPFVLLALGLGLASLSSADLVWDTLSGSAGRSLSSSSENQLGGEWVSVATPLALASDYRVDSISIVGQHLRFDGIGSNSVSDPSPSTFRLNAWSSKEAFLASPLLGDLWSIAAAPTVTSTGTASGGGTPLSTFRFETGGVALSSGTVLIGVNTLSLPVTFGSLYWSRTDPATAPGYRVVSADPSSLETLSSPMALRVEATPVPEPATLLALSVWLVGLARGRKASLARAARRC